MDFQQEVAQLRQSFQEKLGRNIGERNTEQLQLAMKQYCQQPANHRSMQQIDQVMEQCKQHKLQRIRGTSPGYSPGR